MNGLKEVEAIIKSEAVLIANKQLTCPSGTPEGFVPY